MDISTIIGLVIANGMMMMAIFIGGAGFGAYIDVPSVAIVIGGLAGVTIAKWPLDISLSLGKVLLKTIFFKPQDHAATINEIIELAEKARRESIFALEKVEIEDPFTKKAANLAADNRPPEVIYSILQMDVDSMEERHKNAISVINEMIADAPAMGMLGTLIGLVAMLQNLSDPAAIGPGMAVALLTTFYGAYIANILANPCKKKLEYRSNEETTNMAIIITGILGIVAGENPRLIREKLDSFLPPADRMQEEEE